MSIRREVIKGYFKIKIQVRYLKIQVKLILKKTQLSKRKDLVVIIKSLSCSEKAKTRGTTVSQKRKIQKLTSAHLKFKQNGEKNEWMRSREL